MACLSLNCHSNMGEEGLLCLGEASGRQRVFYRKVYCEGWEMGVESICGTTDGSLIHLTKFLIQ